MSSSNDIPAFSDVLSIQSNPEDLFELLYPIGKGATCKVYKAMHKTTLKIFAIKIVDYTKDGPNNISLNYNSIQEEAALMRLLHKNDYILKYYGSYYSRKSNTIWLILEYCYCGSLVDLMFSIDRRYSEIEIATFIEMVLQGLISLHEMNIIHRDIKAQNILLAEDGCAKLGDFGIGIKLTDKQFRRSKKGSPYWMSPQVILQENYDTKTDIWSLGITCVELAESEPPFADLKPNAVMTQIAKQPPKVEEIIDVEEYSESFVDFVKKCLVVDPNKRPTAKELIEHEFIKTNAKGREYIKDLIKENEQEIKNYINEKIKELNINKNQNKKLYSDIIDIPVGSVKPVENKDKKDNNIENDEENEENNSVIINSGEQNKEMLNIIDKTKNVLDEIDIYPFRQEEKKIEENKYITENNIFNMKNPSKKDQKNFIEIESNENNNNYKMNIIDKINNENSQKNNKRSGITTGITDSKSDIIDENKLINKKKIVFNNLDLSNIDDDSEDEETNPIKKSFNIIFEDNRLEKCETERTYLRNNEKINNFNILDAKKIKKYLNGFDINTIDDNYSKNINFSAYKKHKQYFK